MQKFDNLTTIANNFLYYDINDSSLMSDISIYGIGYEKCDADKFEGPKSFPHYSLHLVLNGCGTICLDDNKFNINKDQIFILPPNCKLVYYPDKNDPWEYIWINFSGLNASKLCNRCNITKTSPIYEQISQNIIDEAHTLLNLHKNIFSKDVATIGHFYTMFSFMIDNICDNNKNCSTSKDNHIFKILDYISNNYSDPNLSLTTISNHIGLHYNYLSQIFKKCTGCTFNHYLNLLRIQKACQLIDSGEKYFVSIAEKVGYTDSLYFSKIFKKYKNVSPKNYKSKTD